MKFVIRSMVAVSLVVSPTCGMKAPTQRGQHRQLAGRTVLQQKWDKAMEGKTGSSTMAKVEHHRFNIHTQRKKERDAERDRIAALREVTMKLPKLLTTMCLTTSRRALS